MLLFNRYLLWPLLLTSHFLAISLLSWHLLVQVNFAYPLGYQLLAIGEHIQRYGPENRYKDHFAETTSDEHFHVFSEIVTAIQDSGKGLANISYRLPDDTLMPLMRTPEVVHLQDVANLIDSFYVAGIVGIFIWLVLLAYAYYQRCKFPPLKKILAGFAGVILCTMLMVLAIGPTAVFYWLHVHIFPDEHEWFFFYQDSLMTTLMKAPDLFGFIAMILVGTLVLLWAMTIWGMACGLRGATPDFTKPEARHRRIRKNKKIK
jgi:hypothetical protein